MGTETVRVPDIGDYKDVAVAELLAKPGDAVKADQSLVTVECDKASMEIPTPWAGTLVRLLVGLGDKVSQGSPVAVVRTGEDEPGPSHRVAKRHAKSGGFPAIFVSYRREESADICGRIYDRLTAHFDKDRVFKDVDSIPIGLDFRKVLSQAVGDCAILLAVIGRSWLSARNEQGQRRIDDPRDYVRIEVQAALQRGIPVVPVLVQGAAVPAEHELPEALGGLAFRNGIAVRPDPDFHPDMDRLIRGIEEHFKRSAG